MFLFSLERPEVLVHLVQGVDAGKVALAAAADERAVPGDLGMILSPHGAVMTLVVPDHEAPESLQEPKEGL